MKQTLVWKGGEHPFWLRIGELRALQQHCDAGPFWVYGRLISGQWRVEDVRETLRLGLIGGGMSEKDAGKLVDQSLEEFDFLRHRVVAARKTFDLAHRMKNRRMIPAAEPATDLR